MRDDGSHDDVPQGDGSLGGDGTQVGLTGAQQGSAVFTEQQVSMPMAEARMPCAHPTPARTVMAFSGQLREHAPHSIQSSRFAISANPSRTAKTA